MEVKMDKGMEGFGRGTQAVWGGELGGFDSKASQVPVYHSVTHAYEDIDEWYDVAMGKKDGHYYSRQTNPTVAVFEEKMRILESSEAVTSFSTGMAAISNTLFSFLQPGDRVVSIRDTYGGTSKIFMEFLPKLNIEVELCDTDNHEAILEAISRGCRILYLETPTNPLLKILNIQSLSRVAHEVGAKVIVDNTFATPMNQFPLELGADLCVYSATKFLGGHSDAMGGVVCGGKDDIDSIFHYREITGASLHPMSAYLLLRGLKTLEIRIQRQNENAMTVAHFLEGHPKVEKVFYPGLESHASYVLAKQQMVGGFGGVLSFSLKGSFEKVRQFLPRLKLVHLAASLGAVGTLAGPPRVTSHVEMTEDERSNLGIPEGLIRYSVGIENSQDLLDDLAQALKQV
jgi:cystathionine gamma-synthase